MHAATIRRSLVLVVCAVGVGALYLAPGVARTPGEIEAGHPADEPLRPTTSRSSTATNPAPGSGSGDANPDDPSSGGSSSGGSSSGSDPTGGPSRAGSAGRDDGQDRAAPSGGGGPSPDGGSQRRSPTRVATAYDPADTDREPPQPVRKISTETATATRLGLSWPASHDNVRVVGYHIWLNGFEVASTAQTHATVRWFNDDTSTHVVQVKAVDEAGNESLTSPTVLVTRPGPDPEPSTPAPSPPAPETEPTPRSAASAPTKAGSAPTKAGSAPTKAGSPPTKPGGAPAAGPTSEPTAPVKAPKRTT